MSSEVLEAYIKRYINFQTTEEVEFVWQGGEPTLAGLDFFKKAVELQKANAKGKVIRNSFQTNGILIDEKWCEFFREHNFLIGLSLDGPKHIHDLYRKTRHLETTFDTVIKALRMLQKFDVQYNVMACVTKEAALEPINVYGFFRDEGIDFMQFSPVVERMPNHESLKIKMSLGLPPQMDKESCQKMTAWSVEPERYGDFLIAIFDHWVRRDVGSAYIMNFEWALASWMSGQSTLCVFSKRCGRSVMMEHNGDLYSCDHYMYPRYKLGNILRDDLYTILHSRFQASFGEHKEKSLPVQCRNCGVLFACNGGCPKHRFALSLSGERGLNYLCPSYKKFFTHISGYMTTMAGLISSGYSPSLIMDAIKGPLIISLGKDGPKRR